MRRLPLPLLPRWLRYLGVGAVATAVLYFSVLSPPPVTPPQPTPLWDKQLHFASYAGLALALAYATANESLQFRRRVLLVLGVAAGYGFLVEGVQAFQPGRYASLGDALANVLGVLLASAWFLLESRIRYVPVFAPGSGERLE